MKRLASLTLMICVLFATGVSFAQEKKQYVKRQRTVQKQTEKPQVVELFYKIAKGAHLESQDAKNVSFTLKPTRAFITIVF